MPPAGLTPRGARSLARGTDTPVDHGTPVVSVPGASRRRGGQARRRSFECEACGHRADPLGGAVPALRRLGHRGAGRRVARGAPDRRRRGACRRAPGGRGADADPDRDPDGDRGRRPRPRRRAWWPGPSCCWPASPGSASRPWRCRWPARWRRPAAPACSPRARNRGSRSRRARRGSGPPPTGHVRPGPRPRRRARRRAPRRARRSSSSTRVQTLRAAGLDPRPRAGSPRSACAPTPSSAWRRRPGSPSILTGHVTKDGDLAGPRALEHAVDVVLSFEGEPRSGLRVLAAGKNRFGAEGETAWFEMGTGGARGDRPHRPARVRAGPRRRGRRARAAGPAGARHRGPGARGSRRGLGSPPRHGAGPAAAPARHRGARPRGRGGRPQRRLRGVARRGPARRPGLRPRRRRRRRVGGHRGRAARGGGLRGRDRPDRTGPRGAGDGAAAPGGAGGGVHVGLRAGRRRGRAATDLLVIPVAEVRDALGWALPPASMRPRSLPA